MKLSINPTYFCNFRCSFCYLTPQQLSDKTLLSQEDLLARLVDVVTFEPIDYVDVYGGEIALLPEDYLDQMFATIKEVYHGRINIVTNLSAINLSFLRNDVILSVSYDFECREKHQLVLNNIMKYPDDVHILMLASPELMKKNVDEMISVFNSLGNVKTVEIKPYSTNQANSFGITFSDFEEFVKKWIVSPIKKKFTFTNEQLIQDSLAKRRNAFSDDHVYVTPTGKFAVLEFDLNDNEYFLELDSFQDYLNWTLQEKGRVYMNGYCGKCEYLSDCLSEHLREVKSLEFSCNGFKNLLDWYKNERMES